MIFLFLKFYYYLFFDFIESKNIILSVLSVFTLILGSIGALGQVKLKKLIGYSAVTVNGFFLFSIINNNIFLLETSVMYIFIYIFTILLFFTLICNIQVNNNYLIKLSDLFNLYKLNKLTALISVLLFFSVSGLPPFIGFVSKIF